MSDADDRRQLQDVMLSYAAAVDARDMARYRACFADDVEPTVGFGEATISGADTWTASVESQLEAFSATQHLMSRSWRRYRMIPPPPEPMCKRCTC